MAEDVVSADTHVGTDGALPDVRRQLIDAMRDKLNHIASTRSGPAAAMAMAVPLGPLADAAMAVLAGGVLIPTLPTYDPELAAGRRWYGALSTDETDEGAQYPSAQAVRDDDFVAVTVEAGDKPVTLRMDPQQAADFGLNVVSAAYAPSQPAPQPPADDVVEMER